MSFLEYLQSLTGSTAHKYNDAVGTVNNRIAATGGGGPVDIRTDDNFAVLITIYFQFYEKSEGNYLWSAAINHVKRYRAS